jgi:hypothetical protein
MTELIPIEDEPGNDDLLVNPYFKLTKRYAVSDRQFNGIA